MRTRSNAIVLIVDLTTRCNLVCSYCNRDAGPDGDRPVLSLAHFEAWIRALAGLGIDRLYISFHGGEPLVVDPGVELYAAAARNAAASVGKTRVEYAITTNGTLLSPARVQSLLGQRIGITISIDGTPALHDAHRVTKSGKGSHARAMRGYRNVRAAGYTPVVSSVVTAPAQLREMVAYYRESDIRYVKLKPVRPLGRATTQIGGNRAFFRDMARAFVELAAELAAHNAARPDQAFYEFNLMSAIQFLRGDFGPEDAFTWGLLLDSEGQLWAHPETLGIPQFLLAGPAPATENELRRLLCAGDTTEPLTPRLARRHAQLFSTCADCRSPAFCERFQSATVGGEGGDMCTWSQHLLDALADWHRRCPDETAQLIPHAPALAA